MALSALWECGGVLIASTRRILWSGGFDSTYLVLDALLSGFKVEPFYVQQGSQPCWHKQRRECAALERIIGELPGEYRRRLRKLPREPFIVYRDVWTEYMGLDKELHELYGDDGYSHQTAMLAAVAHELDGAEAAFVSGDSALNDDVSRLFLSAHRIQTPLAGLSKRVILQRAESRGFRHLLDLTWSCEGGDLQAEHKPCGECAPCKARIIPAQALVT